VSVIDNLYVTYIYILKCYDGSYYTGKTNDLEGRIAKHQTGYYKESYTFKRRPVELMWSSGFSTHTDAILIERQIKGWTRKKKEALIEGKFDTLKLLAECQNESHYKNK